MEKERTRREKERRRTENENTDWTSRRGPEANEYFPGGSLSSDRSPPSVAEVVTALYVPGDADEYECWEIPDDVTMCEQVLRYNEREKCNVSDKIEVWDMGYGYWGRHYWGRPDWGRHGPVRKDWAAKRAKYLGSGVAHSARRIHFSEKRNTKKRNLRIRSLQCLDRFESLNGFENMDRFDTLDLTDYWNQ